ncbi:hypothetical protein TpMuguga_01g00135 [Theileria parva strain Muguga]|uniref:Uncharacterized protein n=1 Tax=Theileria parva TaxID=5875 RepID=Q4N9H9_THEPA|nr:uncharacterized protein TpMuguga_01g00135 [Theileria parva strain Muguga]EAN33379.1 hypothetical protein TpMuguga_01g00135 [Theileria parva strain Muguga]|eukprot:XP_765662.1 hypothetical protein [Theileria parva strain Muguga]
MELFYTPSKSLYSKKSDVIAGQSLEDLTKDWHFSESFKSDFFHTSNSSGGSNFTYTESKGYGSNSPSIYGSLMCNDMPWQSKWYLRFEPPKTAGELGIGQYWSYEAPRLSEFAEGSKFDLSAAQTSGISHLGKTSLSNLKNMATIVLSGTTHESLKREAYRKESFKADSDADRASIVSSHLKMPASESGHEKLSILENFKINVAKTHKIKQNKKK